MTKSFLERKADDIAAGRYTRLLLHDGFLVKTVVPDEEVWKIEHVVSISYIPGDDWDFYVRTAHIWEVEKRLRALDEEMRNEN